MYMSSHPDTLTAYVSHYIRKADVASATMQSIDSKGMNMQYLTRGSDVKHLVRIPFDPPLLGYEEVKPRLMSMKVDAEEALGMAKNPIIRSYSIPWKSLLLGPLIPELVLFFVTFSSSPLAAQIVSLTGTTIVTVGWYCMLIHFPEAFYTATLCMRHQTGFALGLLWTLSSFTMGYPFIFRFRKLVKQARIESIMKGN